MASRREIRLISSHALRIIEPAYAATLSENLSLERTLAETIRERTQQKTKIRLAAISLKSLEAADAPLKSSLLANYGIITLADASERLNSLRRIRGIGDVTFQRIRDLVTLESRPTQADIVISNDSSRWTDTDFEYVRLLWQKDLAVRSIEVPKTLESMRDIVDAAKEIQRNTTFLSRFSRGALARALTASNRLAQLGANGRLEALRDESQAALKAIRDVSLASHSAIIEHWRTESASLQVLSEQVSPQPTSTHSPQSPISALPALGSVDLLPEELRNLIRTLDLNLQGFNVPLRGYQDFGARFAIAAKGAILGDEMGLGKTMQALAVAHHLAVESATFRCLVVAPVSILENWRREIQRATQFSTHILHGSERDEAVSRWESEGGVGLTSYQTLRRLQFQDDTVIDLTIVDEAHKIKNPDALQTRAAAQQLARSKRRLLMTGTPLENRTQEFIFLLGLVNSLLGQALTAKFGLGETVHRVRASEFRSTVAQAYLRRNQVDVLAELPELIVNDEIVGLTPDEIILYRETLRSGNHAAVRQAVTIGLGVNSSKIEKLTDLLEEYRESGRKVIVYSTFLRVLDTVCEISGSNVYRIDGSINPTERQSIVDSFSAQPGFSILVVQIDVGGTGLNIQAASVVVIMEPQWKPSTEVQAIGRAHRMGQTERVTVHRLIADDTIDERIDELLDAKQQIFDAVVRESALAHEMPEALESGVRTLNTLIHEEAQRLAV